MKKTIEFVAILLASMFLAIGCSSESVKVFYVKPTGSTECRSGNSPCHSLQYYANHSIFTNNSMFLFLEGEHHLDSVVDIRNVVNLSLVGARSGVEILCESFPAGFYFEGFTRLTIKNFTILNCCSGVNDVAVNLITGSELSLDHVSMISNCSRYYDLLAQDVVGLFDSSMLAGHIRVNYSACNKPSLFKLSSSKSKTDLDFIVNCSDVQIEIKDSILTGHLYITLYVLTSNSVLVYNTLLSGGVFFTYSCNGSNCNCSSNLAKFSRVNISGSYVSFHIGLAFHPKDCIIFIEDSVFTDSTIDLSPIRNDYPDKTRNNDTQAAFHNVIFSNQMFKHDQQLATLTLINTAILLVGCTFENNSLSAIFVDTSTVIFEGNNVFRNNSALVGGGIQLLESSYMYLRPHTHILFENNHADYVGGAIYTDYVGNDDVCFFRMDSPTLLYNTIEIAFSKNTADFAGSSIYGHITSCCFSILCKEFKDIFKISNTETDPSAIASDPSEVCLCNTDSNQPNCSYGHSSRDWNRSHVFHAFPGQDVPVRLAVVGDFNGVLSSAIRAYFPFPYNATLGPHQVTQASGTPICKNFSYSVNTKEKEVTFGLIPDQSFLELISTNSLKLFVTVHLKDCPLGFSLSHTTPSCVCDPVISRANIRCFINDQSFLRPANSWLGFIKESSTVLFHPNCPIGYCLPDDVNITSNTSDSQCEPHRTGLLCGECEEGYSLTLGNPTCAECTNTNLLLILPLAVAGLLLVAILFALNLTVTEGSINGLMFYANIIGMNYPILFSKETSYLYTFLAWLNLDLGINTCLFNGMDGYAETWLQFVFPFYLWMIVLVIILLYREFPKIASKLGGENAVKVLATLLLLSYTKLQRTVVIILSFTTIQYPDSIVRYVWLYDANVEFFKGKHLYLGIAGIFVLVFLIVPYTLCLAFFQQLQACSGHRLFQWVNKLKPVFDAYAGPYKDKYRFWTGMLLVVRTLLIILFTINTSASVDLNLLIVSVVSCALLIVIANGAYKKWPLNFLESFFYAQPVVFAVGVVYARHNHGNTTAVADTSIGLTLAVSLALLGYHVLCRITSLYYYHLRGYVEVQEEELTHERIVA